MDHTKVSAVKASSVTLKTWLKESEKNTIFFQNLTGQSTQRLSRFSSSTTILIN